MPRGARRDILALARARVIYSPCERDISPHGEVICSLARTLDLTRGGGFRAGRGIHAIARALLRMGLCNPSVIRQRRLPAPFDKGAYWARITCHRGAMDSMPSHGDGLHTAFRQITYRSGGFKM